MDNAAGYLESLYRKIAECHPHFPPQSSYFVVEYLNVLAAA